MTWGVFDVPDDTASLQAEVDVRLSSLSDQPETAVVRVFSLVEGTTTKRPILRQFVTVPANGASGAGH